MERLAAGEPEGPENLGRQNKLEFLISAYKGCYMGTKAYFNITTTDSFFSLNVSRSPNKQTTINLELAEIQISSRSQVAHHYPLQSWLRNVQSGDS